MIRVVGFHYQYSYLRARYSILHIRFLLMKKMLLYRFVQCCLNMNLVKHYWPSVD